MRNGESKTKDGTKNLHPNNGTHWVAYIDETYSVSSGCPASKFLLVFIKKMANLHFPFKKPNPKKKTVMVKL